MTFWYKRLWFPTDKTVCYLQNEGLLINVHGKGLANMNGGALNVAHWHLFQILLLFPFDRINRVFENSLIEIS